MAANTRVRPRWINGALAPSGAEMSTLDANLAGLVNGDGGGTFNPSNPLIVGGAGMYALGPWVMDGGAAGCITPAASGARIVHGDGDAFVLPLGHSGQTLTVEQSFVDAVSVRPNTYVSTSSAFVLNAMIPGAEFSLPLRVRDGAILFNLTTSFIVTGAHGGGVPALLPKLRIVATALDGTKYPLKQGGTADASGYIRVPTPASGSAWHAAGAVQTITYTTTAGIDQRTVDRTAYSYSLEVVDENGANAFAAGLTTGNQWLGIVMALHNIGDMRPE